MADTATLAPVAQERAPLPAPEDRGRTTIADGVVSRVASIAASEIEAVVDTRKGWTKLVRKGLPHAEATVAGETSSITVEVAATWPTPLAPLVERVRAHVTERVDTLVGVTVSRVDVTVADVVHLDAPARRVV
ncbi:Asp23/Gls24 family envelope stress response protein [Aeromicrobium erythreum]|uniref:Asp23/Gls24 family envelope stress response protein n=1 Tax=Aeromicrobium erythreum TaxID=2041 RepID=UPI00082A2F9D|nr:Asp23/Gls24 family envelope stress response protein [Aeromicrobium erythreum]